MKTYSLTTLIVLFFLFSLPDLFSQESSFSLKDKLYKQTSIIFASYRDGNMDIYVMNSDGSNQTRLTNNPAKDEYPTWSPDGKRIAFGSNRDSYCEIYENAEVYIMNADGSSQTNLTNNPAYDHFPFWSPDGKKIAFASERDGNMNIYIMNADGSNQTRLTDNTAHDVKPQWSPDGKKIAFQTTRHGKEEIYVMNSDGSNEIRLTNNPAWDGCLSWSPDGKKIAFASYRDGNDEIYVMNADGSEQINITNNPSDDMAPTWSPDGKEIAFYSLRNDVPPENNKRLWYEWNAEIYIMNADGSEQINITNNPAYDGYPGWSPFLKAQNNPSIHDLISLQADKIFDSLVNIRRDIHENPELSFKEIRTSKLVAEYLSTLGLDVRTNVGGNGVVGILHGKGIGKIIGWRAEMDAYKTDFPDVVDFKSKVDGIRHICGHDVNTTIGLGIANVLSTLKDSIAGTVVFIFQPAEEAFGGARAMIDDSLFIIIKPDEIYGSHVSDIPVGTVAIKSGAVFAYAEPISITYKNINIEDKDSVVSFTKTILTKYSNLDRKLWEKCHDPEIGVFSRNSIFKDFVSLYGVNPPQETDQLIILETVFLGDDEKQLDSLPDKLTGVIGQSAFADHLISVSSPGYSFMPYISNDPILAEKARITISTVYGRNAIRLMDGVILPFNDDFAYLQKDIPCGYSFLGGSNYDKGIISNPHTPDFALDEKCIAIGVKYFSSMIFERLIDK